MTKPVTQKVLKNPAWAASNLLGHWASWRVVRGYEIVNHDVITASVTEQLQAVTTETQKNLETIDTRRIIREIPHQEVLKVYQFSRGISSA